MAIDGKALRARLNTGFGFSDWRDIGELGSAVDALGRAKAMSLGQTLILLFASPSGSFFGRFTS